MPPLLLIAHTLAWELLSALVLWLKFDALRKIKRRLAECATL